MHANSFSPTTKALLFLGFFALYKFPFWGSIKYLYLDLLLLLNIYFAVYDSDNFTLISSFFLGLAFDILNENIFGVTALKFSIATYFLQANLTSFSLANVWQQMFYIFLLVNFIHVREFVVFTRLNMHESSISLENYLLFTALAWPIFVSIVDRLIFRQLKKL